MTTQLQRDLEQAVSDYLQIETCVGKDIHWFLNDMWDEQVIAEKDFIACSALVELRHSEYILSNATKEDCLKLALEIMPKYIRDNLMLSLTLYKLAKGEDNDFHSFLEYNVYQELEITKNLFHRRYGLQELTGFDNISDDKSVDSIIRLTFPSISLAPVLDVEDNEIEGFELEDDDSHWEWVKKQFDKRIASEKLIPTQVKELGHSYLKIWEYLRDNQEKWFTANQLAERFECTPQWVRDAIGTMRKQGIDIFGHTRKGYILRTSVVDQLVK